MENKYAKIFVSSVFVILFTTGLIKILSLFGNSKLLLLTDPLIGIEYKYLFLLVGILELIVGLVCLLSRKILLQVSLILWLTSYFVIYRVGLYLIGYQKPCKCLGNFVSILNLNDEIVDFAMKLIIGYLIIGSIFIIKSCSINLKNILKL